MGLIFDKIDAEVAAREGLIAAAGVGRLHLLPMRDRSLIEKRTRNIRAIRNDAAAKLGVLPGFEVVKFGQTFRVDFHKPNKAGWGFIGPRGVHQIYASATNLSTGKVHIWNGARKERLQCPNMPTGIRTANVIGTDAQGDPIYEIAENPLEAALAHFRHAALLGITEEPASDAVKEFGNTTTVVYGYNDASIGRSLGDTAGEDWSVLVAGAGNSISGTNGQYTVIAYALSDSITDKWRANWSYPIAFDTSVLGGDVVVSATYSYSQNDKADSFPGGSGLSLSLVEWTPAVDVDTFGLADYGQLGATSFGAIALADTTNGVFNDITLNASGIEAIDGSGYTTLGLRPDAAITGTPPTWADTKTARIRAYGVDTAGTADDPKLTIEHAAAPASGGSMISPLNLISRLGR